jgi:hypothetical protein
LWVHNCLFSRTSLSAKQKKKKKMRRKKKQ